MPKYVSALYTLQDEVENISKLIINSSESDLNKHKLLNEVKQTQINWEKTLSIPYILKKHVENDMTKWYNFTITVGNSIDKI